MANQFDGQVVLVGGSSGGIGRAAATMLLEGGAKVALHYRSNSGPVEDLIGTFGAENTLAVQADLTDASQVADGVLEIVSRFGKLDGFLNTVGTALRIQPFLELSDAHIDETIAVELRSVITVVQSILPHLVSNGGGRIVLIGSDAGKVGTSGEVISAACRGGIIAFAKSIAREHARNGVLVNVVCPGPTDTQLWSDLVDNDEFGEKIGTAMIRAIPLRRIGTSDEVAAAAVFLLSPAASYITGQAISVSGGLTMS
jgi:2-hydroxycyclohexanecarboxyl-CoA dehydrogenase